MIAQLDIVILFMVYGVGISTGLVIGVCLPRKVSLNKIHQGQAILKGCKELLKEMEALDAAIRKERGNG